MNKNIRKYVIIPVLALSVLAVIDLPKSHAKYIKNEEFAYNSYIYSLKNNEDSLSVTLNEEESNYLDAIFDVSFKRNQIMYEDSAGNKSDLKDSYNLNITDTTNSCEVTTTNPVNFTTINDNDTITYKIKCSIPDDKKVTLSFDINEAITNYNNEEETPFTYLSYSETKTVDMASESETILYDEAIEKLKETYESNVSSESLEILMQYFNSNFINYLSSNSVEIKDDDFRSKANNLTGFSFTENGSERTYTFDSNFLGYAYTWKRDYHTSDKTHYQFAFSITDKDSRDQIFRQYLSTYGSDSLKANDGINTIMSYIDTYTDKINAAFNNKILEIRPETIDSNNNLIVLYLNDSIIDSINNKTTSANSPLSISNTGDEYTIWQDGFMNSLNIYTFIDNDIYFDISDSFGDIDNLTDNGPIGNSVLTNVNNTNPITFTDFHIISGTSKTALINIYSTAGSTSTYYQVYDLTIGNEITLAFPTNSRMLSADFTELGEKTDVEIINQINSSAGSTKPSFSTFGTPYETIKYSDNITHNMYEVNGVTYDIYTKDGIRYITYTLQ